MKNLTNANLGIGNNYIHTPTIFLEKNLMIWNNHTMIQLSNISYLSAEKLAVMPFPFFAAILVLVGFMMLTSGESLVFAGLLLCGIGGAWLYLWYKENERRKNGAILQIKMNSGTELNFEFANKEFLWVVAEKLQNIMINGGVTEKVEINITNSTIRDSNVLTGLAIDGH